MLKKALHVLRKMPHSAYIMLLFTLKLSCAMLLISLLLFTRCLVTGEYDRELYMTAVLLLENPAGLLFVGGIGAAYFIDRS